MLENTQLLILGELVTISEINKLENHYPLKMDIMILLVINYISILQVSSESPDEISFEKVVGILKNTASFS
jgi:hypothetical protein